MSDFWVWIVWLVCDTAVLVALGIIVHRRRNRKRDDSDD